ncbi:MAG TPA: TetR/AcrR family transcriptional regulator [Solirubrobacterales bacterium]|nr:TetR/AcrR family transcriptional regulator [Solirubrobacterales bacterium]
MSRPVDPTRKPELLEEIVDYLGEHGVATMTMRNLADGIGVSTTVLTYHFGGKKKLLQESVAAAEKGMLESMREGIAAGGVPEGICRFWDWISAGESRIRKLGVVLETMALDNGSWAPVFSGRPSVNSVWIEMIARSLVADGVPPDEVEPYTTMIHGALLGLCLDIWDSGDEVRVRQAIDLLVSYTEQVIEQAPARSV